MITVFRNGKKVAGDVISNVDIPWVIRQMTGKELDQTQVYCSGKVSDKVLLEVNNLTGEKFTDISFTLKKGEILGFSGLVGAGSIIHYVAHTDLKCILLSQSLGF